MEIEVPPRRIATDGGAAQDEALEIAPEVQPVADQEVKEATTTTVTLHEATDSGRGAPVPAIAAAVEVSLSHTSPCDKIARNTLQCEEKKSPSSDVKVTSKSGGSSCRSFDPLMPAGYKCPLTAEGKESTTAMDTFGPLKKVKVEGPTHLPTTASSSACALGSKERQEDDWASNLEDDDILKEQSAHERMHEQHLDSSSSGTSTRREERPHGTTQDADARTKVKMMCSKFESMCRAMVKAAEQRSLKVRRIDLAADKLIRKLPEFTKHGPIVGTVPGVEVGDQFLYRVQLALVGLHRPYQGGIDTTKDENGVPIAISIVASGGYPDELPCSGELIYTGSGNKDGRDQKLVHGNLALKNCITMKTPVRVIHGAKGLNTEEGSHSMAREISTFTYDGLYHVLDCWREGQPGSKVFKFRLQRIPGQPELPLHIAKGIMKNNMHQSFMFTKNVSGIARKARAI